MKKISMDLLKYVFVACLSCTTLYCGGSSGTSDTTQEAEEDDTGNGGVTAGDEAVDSLTDTASVVASVFDSTVDSEAALKKNSPVMMAILEVVSSKAQAAAGTFDPNNTCNSTPPDGLNFDISGIAGTYGSSSNPITVTESDFCYNDETAANNTGLGPDGDGLFATFSVRGDKRLTATCSRSGGGTNQVTITGDGIWRYTLSFVEIYSNFIVTDASATEYVVDCSVILNPDGSMFDASCSDTSSLKTMTLDSGSSCTLSVTDDGV